MARPKGAGPAVLVRRCRLSWSLSLWLVHHKAIRPWEHKQCYQKGNRTHPTTPEATKEERGEQPTCLRFF